MLPVPPSSTAAPLNQYLGNAFDMGAKQIKKLALCPGIEPNATLDYIKSGWGTNGLVQTYSLFSGQDRWGSGETAVTPADIAQSKIGNMRLLMADSVYYHTDRAAWFFNHGAGGGYGGYIQPTLSTDGLNELFTDGHVEWKKLGGTDISNIKASAGQTGTSTYPSRVYQQTTGKYPFYY